MGVMNLIKANWYGKVGQTVGAKWKNRSTIRSYTAPSNPSTAEQQRIRGIFKGMTGFIALFAPELKGLSALDTKGESIRNAIIKLNKNQYEGTTFDPSTLVVSRGGLPMVSGIKAVYSATAPQTITVTWTPSTVPSISARAKVVCVCVDPETKVAYVGSGLQSSGTFVIQAPSGFELSVAEVYGYLLDYRGSAKVASPSVKVPLS